MFFMLQFIILALLFGLIFLTPLRLSFATDQTNLFWYYLALFLVVAATPVSVAFAISRRNYLPLVSVPISLLLLFTFFSTALGYNISKAPGPLTSFNGQKTKEGVYLDLRGLGPETLKTKAKDFCFKVFLPNYKLRDPSLKNPVTGFSKAYASVKKCENQIVYLSSPTSGYIRIIQIPKNYDFTFRKGFEDIKYLRDKSLSGTKITISGQPAYQTTLLGKSANLAESRFGGLAYSELRLDNEDLNTRESILWYMEIENTIIFFNFAPSTRIPMQEYLKVAGSMAPIN
ncbi:MAG: hypothetical protein A2126_01400 [Candidatus Woykebacteria bacterium GWB1_45_5]|uniref:Uncharacterized protein n=1 Tax=Candidatus Woykebacteria bacterium GWB1_45_5 TaxID=1802592 RepID=A0A1G1W7Q9_9BACT|nr:MAG: hypothetical protein A2126_01400 [Candidatus Woykebacteria bacterium GWB1_45_5]